MYAFLITLIMEEVKTRPPIAVYYRPEEWPYISMKMLYGGAVEGPYVESGLEATILKKLRNAVERAKEGEGTAVVLHGFKGVGKSAAAVAALHHLLQDDNVAVVDVDLSADVSEQQLAGAVAEAKRQGRVPVVYADVNRLEFYSGAWSVRLMTLPDVLTKTVVTAKREGAALLVVIDDNNYTWTVEKSPLLARALSDAAKVDAYTFTRSTQYLSALVEKYSGCSSDVAKEVGYTIYANFDDAHSLLAVLAAQELRRSGCVADVNEAVNRAKREAARHMLNYLWRSLANENETNAKVVTSILILTAYLDEKTLERSYMTFVGYGIPPRGLLFYTLKSAMVAAFHRAYGVEKDELCQGSDEGPCRLISAAAKFVAEYIPWEGSIEESIKKYVKDNAEILLFAFLFS